MSALEITVRSQTNGFKTLMSTCIEPIRHTEIFSGFVRPMRFGKRSAKIMNNIVIRRNEHKNDVVSRYCAGTNHLNRPANTSVKAASPTIPPRMATALMPI